MRFARKRLFVAVLSCVAWIGIGPDSSDRASAAVLFDGHDLEIGWTGSTPFGDYVNTGMGVAKGEFAAPMTSAYFTTANFASSTDTRTWVTDTNIRLANAAPYAGWAAPYWFQYVDVDDTLPDFRTLAFSLDEANMTAAGYDLGTYLQVRENAIALNFGVLNPGQSVSVNVAVPEPTLVAPLALAAAHLALRRRARRTA